MQTNHKNGNADGTFQNLVVLLVMLFVARSLWVWSHRLKLMWLHNRTLLLLCLIFLLVGLGLILIGHIWNYWQKIQIKKEVTGVSPSSILVGKDTATQEEVYLKPEFRTAHTQVIGTTNAGKTASVIMPWAVQDIEQGRGLLIIDGKADQGFLNSLYAYASKFQREKDFKVFSLANIGISSTYNPFSDGTPEQIAERAFSAFNITDPYYGSIQFSALRTVIALIVQRGQKPMPGLIRELLRNKEALGNWLEGIEDPNLILDVQRLCSEKEDEFRKNYSGIVTALGHFSQGNTLSLYNTPRPEIDLMEVIRKKQICYFQLPTMQFPFLGQATGRLLLQNLQSVVSEIQLSGQKPDSLFSVYLDDFNDYIYPGFASLLNKARSANMGVVFCHQSLGDLEKVSPDFKQIVMTNTNVKVIMRSNDPDTAEQFAKVIGTKATEKTTQKRVYSVFGSQDTGDQSVREVEEYRYHPNVFKSELGQGEGIVIIPHPRGSEVRRVRFGMVPDLPKLVIPSKNHAAKFQITDVLLGTNGHTVEQSFIKDRP